MDEGIVKLPVNHPNKFVMNHDSAGFVQWDPFWKDQTIQLYGNFLRDFP